MSDQVLATTDIAGAAFVVATTRGEPKTVENSRAAIVRWLRSVAPGSVIAMEATGRLYRLLADLAYAAGHTVYVINPARIKNYGRGVGQRAKTDRLDARLIARYVERERGELRPYEPATRLQRQLRALLTQRSAVVKATAALRLCFKAIADDVGCLTSLNGQNQRLFKQMQASLDAIDRELEELVRADPATQQRRDLLQTISGIGPLNSIALTMRFTAHAYANSDSVVAAYGLDPRPNDSGSKVGRRALTKEGNPEDRRLIYLAGKAAAKTKTFKPIYQALRSRGLSTTAAFCIIARKLLRIAFAVWQSGREFDPRCVGQPHSARSALA